MLTSFSIVKSASVFTLASAMTLSNVGSSYAQNQDNSRTSSITTGLGAAGDFAGALGESRIAGILNKANLGGAAIQATQAARRGDIASAVSIGAGTAVGAIFAFGAAGAVLTPAAPIIGAAVGVSVGVLVGIRVTKEAARFGKDIINRFRDNRSEQEKRLDRAGLTYDDIVPRAPLNSPERIRQYINDVDAEIAERLGESFIPRLENTAERQLQAGLASQTTGLTSHIGQARPSNGAALDPALAQTLATELRSPYVIAVENQNRRSTGTFAGTEGVNIAGALNVFAFDSGNLQDGDRVRLTVRDSTGTILTRNITLTFAGATARATARRGFVNVTITALNNGSVPPNTGGLRVSGEVAGSQARNFNLNPGESGTLVVRVLGRR